MQIATLMQLQGNRADPAQLERLQFMLSEKNNEIETLMLKVRELEKEKVSVQLNSHLFVKHILQCILNQSSITENTCCLWIRPE